MPDAGDFETGNAPATPATWGDAFATLPQETADAGGWQRVQARLPAATTPRVRRRWPLWFAAAASLGLVLALPLRMSREANIDLPGMTADQAPNRDAFARHPGAGRDDGSKIASGVAARTARKHTDPPRAAPAQRPIRTIAEPAGATRVARSDPPTQPIESLYAESAQLEQLLALVRDERVASGTSAALSSELDERVAEIDAALTEPGLAAADRDRLWRQRVDAMQQLVGIETTRMLSARGESFNASLVSID
jgi:hypothetical protein